MSVLTRRDFLRGMFSLPVLGGALLAGSTEAANREFYIPVQYYGLAFGDLCPRAETRGIVIHNSGSENNASAWDIHQYHLSKGWSGIGYHYVVRMDGTIDAGRPLNMQGAHSENYNDCTIGICLVGNFNSYEPTPEQLYAAEQLTAYLSIMYGLPMNRRYILGHRELNDTSCPGNIFYDRMDDFVDCASNFL